MTQQMIINLARRTLMTVILVAAPMLGLGLLVGLLVSIFQATTQIQEQTLVFIPKILAVLVAIIIFGPWMLSIVTEFTLEIFKNIPGYI